MYARLVKSPRQAVQVVGDVVGYVRVSTEEQADSGAGLEAQRRTIRAAVAARGWTLSTVYEDAGKSGKGMAGRPGLQQALRAVRSHQADALVVAKLDRLSRSVLDFATVMDRRKNEGWVFIALDMGIDTTTAAGRMFANINACFAEYERDLSSERTTKALAVKRSEGVKLGGPKFTATPPATRDRISAMRAAGESFGAIARQLNDEHVPTAQGGQRETKQRWYASTVRVVAAEDPSQASSPEEALNRATPGRAT